MTKERQLEFDIVYMGMAECVSKLSYAQRSKVGCVIVTPEGQVISQGYNGTPSGMDNCCEIEEVVHDFDSDGDYSEYIKLVTKKEVLHAESNAITKCAKYGGSTNNSTIYVTLSPCYECAKLIIQAGIKRVVYKDIYRITDGLDLLTQAGIICEQIDIENKKIIKYNK